MFRRVSCSSTVLLVAATRGPLSCISHSTITTAMTPGSVQVFPLRYFHTTSLRAAPADISEDLAKDIKHIINHDRFVMFLTGTPEQPRCRFTMQIVELMDQIGAKYSFFNILEDDEVCEGLKVYSEWPTYPQVYVDGELIGGFDVCKTMMLDGSLTKMLKDKKLL